MRLLKIALIAIIAGALALWLILPPSVHTWRITDIGTPQTKQFSDWFNSWSTGLMAIRVTGHSTLPAKLITPLGTIQISPGEYDYITNANEAWSNKASISFIPSSGAKSSDGEVVVQVCLGFTPDWVLATPEGAQLVFPSN